MELNDIKKYIGDLIDTDRLNEAETLIESLNVHFSNDPDTYNLTALYFLALKESNQAIEVLKKGLSIFPDNFDILYNLGYIFELEKEYIESYYFYLQADYECSEEKRYMISDAFKRLTPHLRSYFDLTYNGNFQVGTKLIYGDKAMTTSIELKTLKNEQELTERITTSIHSSASTVLEVEFGMGAISRTLALSGFQVEAIDSNKGSLMTAILQEWQVNFRENPSNKAKFYPVTLTLEKISELKDYDVIILTSDYYEKKLSSKNYLIFLLALMRKTKRQLIFYYSGNSKNINKHFYGYTLNKIFDKIYMVEKIKDVYYSVPTVKELNHIYTNQKIIKVNIENCIDQYGFSYHGKGFHPFKRLLEEYIDNKELSYRESSLSKFYSGFMPSNLSEALKLKKDVINKFEKGWFPYPWSIGKSIQWNAVTTFMNTRPGGNHFWGPNSIEFGKNEMQRLIDLYELFKITGYLPEVFSDGYINGYLLKNKDQYRFVVTEGQHRLAVLSMLKDEILVKLTDSKRNLKIVDLQDVLKWPQVVNGSYTPDEAKIVFSHLFNLNGSERKV